MNDYDESDDPNELHTALVVSAPYKDEESIKPAWDRLHGILQKQIQERQDVKLTDDYRKADIVDKEDAKRLFEAEVQARVNFKLKELKDSMRNRAAGYWGEAFANMSQRAEYKWEAFNEMLEMMEKEQRMATPSDAMVLDRRECVRKAVMSKIETCLGNRFRGMHYFHELMSTFNRFIEEAQRYL